MTMPSDQRVDIRFAAERNGDDKYRIIPRGATVARVTPFEMQVRTLAEYDVNYLQDRIRSDIFINGKPAGVYAVAAVGDEFLGDSDGLRHALEALAPKLEKMLIDEFMGFGYRRRVQELDAKVHALETYINRPRWWQFHPARRRWAAFKANARDSALDFLQDAVRRLSV